MLVDFIYDNPTWWWGSVFIGVLVLLSCAGLTIFIRFVGLEVRSNNNDPTQAVISVVGGKGPR